jgi:hypothetical protein
MTSVDPSTWGDMQSDMIAHGRTMTSMPTADNEHVFAALQKLGTPPSKAMCTLCIHMREYERKHEADFDYVGWFLGSLGPCVFHGKP